MDDGDDFSEYRQAILDDEDFRKRFAQEVRFAIDPVRGLRGNLLAAALCF